MSKYKGLFTFDVDSHKYLPIEQVDGIITDMNYRPKTEPLIKDKNTRKAVRAWAEVNSVRKVLYTARIDRTLSILTDMDDDDYNINFIGRIKTLKDGEEYTIDELCGDEKE